MASRACRPVVLSTPQARRIDRLEQWQLRRVVRVPEGGVVEGWIRDEQDQLRAVCARAGARPSLVGCPFGAVDDWLWVRERWHVEGGRARRRVVYESTEAADPLTPRRAWLSAMLMPQASARLWLRLYNVRCQRVQDAVAIDYAAEGVACPAHDTEYSHCQAECPARRGAFARAWDAAHSGAQQWSSNPWVWAISFTRFDSEGFARATAETDRALASSAPSGTRRPRRKAPGRRAAARKA